MLPDWLPWLLQVNDSAFPSGAYAHSLGLEELVQAGVVRTPEELEGFLMSQVVPGLLAFEVPVLAAAHELARAGDLLGLRALDDELEGWKLAGELRAASRQLGSRRLAMTRLLEEGTLAAEYAALGGPCHQVVVAGIELRRLPVAAAGCAFAQQSVAGYALAAMKLMRLGQEKCQGVIRRCVVGMAGEVAAACAVPVAQAGWFNPLLEIASMRHARAAERLFIS